MCNRITTRRGVKNIRADAPFATNVRNSQSLQQQGIYPNLETLDILDLRQLKFKMKEMATFNVYNIAESTAYITRQRLRAKTVARATYPSSISTNWAPGSTSVLLIPDYEAPPQSKVYPILNPSASNQTSRSWWWQGVPMLDGKAVTGIFSGSTFWEDMLPSDLDAGQLLYDLRKWHAAQQFCPFRHTARIDPIGYTNNDGVPAGVDASSYTQKGYNTLPLDRFAAPSSTGGTWTMDQKAGETNDWGPNSWSQYGAPTQPTNGAQPNWDFEALAANEKVAAMLPFVTENAQANDKGHTVTNFETPFDPWIAYSADDAAQVPYHMFSRYRETAKGEMDRVFARKWKRFKLPPGGVMREKAQSKTYGGTIINCGSASFMWRDAMNVAADATVGRTNPALFPVAMGGLGLIQQWNQIVALAGWSDTANGVNPFMFTQLKKKQYPLLCPTDSELWSYQIRGNTMPLLKASIISGDTNWTEQGPAEVLVKKEHKIWIKVYVKRRTHEHNRKKSAKSIFINQSEYRSTQDATHGFASVFGTSAPQAIGIQNQFQT